jgi:hypothetical protein
VQLAGGRQAGSASKIYVYQTIQLIALANNKKRPAAYAAGLSIYVPEEIRTPDLQFRKLLLYPAELLGQRYLLYNLFLCWSIKIEKNTVFFLKGFFCMNFPCGGTIVDIS